MCVPTLVVCHRRLGLNNWGKQANGKFNIEITIRKCPACNLSSAPCVNYKQCKAHVHFGVWEDNVRRAAKWTFLVNGNSV